MTRGSEVVDVARRWIGTPYKHQASTLGAGADCLGLIRGVWRELVGREPELVPAYSPDWGEPTGDEVLLAAARRWLIPIDTGRSGEGTVLVFRMRNGGIAKHMAISASRGGAPSFIHAYTGHGVIETALSAPWARKIAGRFEFPTGEI